MIDPYDDECPEITTGLLPRAAAIVLAVAAVSALILGGLV